MFVVGSAKMVAENAGTFALQEEALEVKSERTFDVFEVVGATIVGITLTAWRHHISPSGWIVILSLITIPSFLLMTYPVAVPIE